MMHFQKSESRKQKMSNGPRQTSSYLFLRKPNVKVCDNNTDSTKIDSFFFFYFWCRRCFCLLICFVIRETKTDSFFLLLYFCCCRCFCLPVCFKNRFLLLILFFFCCCRCCLLACFVNRESNNKVMSIAELRSSWLMETNRCRCCLFVQICWDSSLFDLKIARKREN